MKLSAVTSLFKYYPLPEALRVIAAAGYQGVELWGGFPHGFVDDFFDGQVLDRKVVAACRDLLSTSCLEPVAFLPEQCFYPVNLLIDDAPPFDAERLRARSYAYFERAIAVTAALEIPKMLVTTPFWGWYRQPDGWYHRHDKPLDRVIETFAGLARTAERNGVTLVLEPLTHLETTAVETLDDLLAVLDGVASPALAAMVDTGHVHVTAHRLGLDSDAYFREHVERLGARLQHVHVDDNRGDVDAHLVPGEGTFDFQRGYGALREHGYDGYLSAELMMFGANPVPPEPASLLHRTRAHASALWETPR